MSMYDLAHEIRVQRESQEKALLRKTAILLLDFKKLGTAHASRVYRVL